MNIQETEAVTIYSPEYSKIDLVCGTMPSKADSSVILCAEAAFTGELLDDFKHSNIAGDHVSSGKRYRGYKCKKNTGAFVYYDSKYNFAYKDYSKLLDTAAAHGGMGFGQEMIIHKGELVTPIRKLTSKNQFRALCEYQGKLCIVDSKDVVNYSDFRNALKQLGVTEAIYLDMGYGWNFSWWRDEHSIVHDIHSDRIRYTTNWITFYKR